MDQRRILVVDDEPGVTRSIRLNLETSGRYEVRTENRSRAALAAAREFKPDLILLDVMMPEMDGGEVAGRIKEDPFLKAIPIVFLTAIVARDETKGHEAEVGGEYFLAKPVDLAELSRVVQSHLPR
jgi:two-component system OmpR family response regulator